MLKSVRWGGTLLLLLVFSLLMMATSKEQPCVDDCIAFTRLYDAVVRDRPFVYYAGDCSQTMICVRVNDTLQRNWAALADTTCRYAKQVGLNGRSVAVVGVSRGDTLAKLVCR